MKEDDASYRRAGTSIAKRDFGLTKLKKPLDDADTEAFWTMVAAATETALGPADSGYATVVPCESAHEAPIDPHRFSLWATLAGEKLP